MVVAKEKNFPLPAEQTEDSWGGVLKALKANQAELASRMERLKPADLRRQVPGHRYTVEFMLEGVAHHALYHAGQISMLKRARQRLAIDPQTS